MSLTERRHDAVALAVATWALLRMGLAAHDASPWAWASWLAAAAFLSLLLPSLQHALRERIRAAPVLRTALPAALIAIGIAALLGTGVIATGRVPLWRLLGVPVVATLAIVAAGRGQEPLGGRRLLGLAVCLGLVAGGWDRGARIAVPGNLRLGFSFFCAAALGIYLLGVVRVERSFDVRLGLGARQVATALGAVGALVLIAIPLGLLVDYVVWNPKSDPPLAALERFVALVVFVGLPEELLFRGMIQEGLSRLAGPRAGLVAASVVFGLVHVTKQTGLLSGQVNALGLNWRYAVLAALAGLAYGLVYQRTRRLGAAALTHGGVDWLWSSFFLR